MTDSEGVAGSDLTDVDLLRELEVLHATRHATLRHGSAQALEEHTHRSAELESEYLTRYPEREIDPRRTRTGARSGTSSVPASSAAASSAAASSAAGADVRTGADQPWDPEDLAVAEGRDPTAANVEHARQELAEDGPAAIERTVP